MEFYVHSRYAAWVAQRCTMWGFVCGESNVHVCHLAWKYKYIVAGQTNCNRNCIGIVSGCEQHRQ